MAEMEFSRGHVENLAAKLELLSDQLDEHEQRLLLTIFEAARDNVSPRFREQQTEPTLANLQEQILNAFIPGEDNDFTIQFRIGRPPGG
jgi:hypothetical protein